MQQCPVCGAELNQGASYCRSCGSAVSPGNSDTAAEYREAENSQEPDVKRCSFCSKPLSGEDAIYFRCRYCGEQFCNEHRLPENHLCRSAPTRRNVPTTSGLSSSGGGYWSTSGRARTAPGSSWFNISKPGRNLAIAIVVGLVLGAALSLVSAGGIPLVYYFVQTNVLVLGGWIPPLFTSAIVVLPTSQGLLDVFFNAIAVIWIDRVLTSAYTARQYYLVFIITALAGNLLTLLYGPDLISFGASGGIFGLLAGALTADYARTGSVNKSFVVWFLFIFVYSTFTGGVNVFAHLGGALFGLLLGYFVGKHNFPRNSRRSSSSYF